MESSNLRREKWSLTQESLDAFLAFLDADRDQAGHKYEQLRRKMITVFRGRGVDNPEDAADEAMNRVIRRQGDTEIQNLNAYALQVARVVASEIHAKPVLVPLDGVPELSQSANPSANEEEQQTYRRQVCLEKCLERLKPQDRELIDQWYIYTAGQKIENKRELAAKRGVTVSTLRVQACRARDKLHDLVQERLKSESF